MNSVENLDFSVVGKFSYGCLEIQELRKLIPTQCGVKGEVQIDLLCFRHALIRCTLLEDYVNSMSRGAYYIKARDGMNIK